MAMWVITRWLSCSIHQPFSGTLTESFDTCSGPRCSVVSQLASIVDVSKTHTTNKKLWKIIMLNGWILPLFLWPFSIELCKKLPEGSCVNSRICGRSMQVNDENPHFPRPHRFAGVAITATTPKPLSFDRRKGRQEGDCWRGREWMNCRIMCNIQ